MYEESRSLKLKKPIGTAFGVPIWGVIPFYPTTLVCLHSAKDKKKFDEIHQEIGFTSKDIDELMKFAIDTRRIQFIVTDAPTCYKNLDFLQPLFTELRPPTTPDVDTAFIPREEYKQYKIEFDTLANFGYKKMASFIANSLGEEPNEVLSNLSSEYVVLKSLNPELADEIGTMMIIDPPSAFKVMFTLNRLISDQQLSPIKTIPNFSKKALVETWDIIKEYDIKVETEYPIPFEIGRFILTKLILYPLNLQGCQEIIQYYDAYELNKVLNALDEGVKNKNIDVIEKETHALSEIIGNIWKEADKIVKRNIGIANFGYSLSFGLMGYLSTGWLGGGVLSGLGFYVADKITGLKLESLSEKTANFFSPDYLVSIHDFRKKHNLK